MGSVGDEGDMGALSDFEDDELEAAPVELPVANTTTTESLKVALAELEQERQARKILEASKAEGDANFTRLKALIQEAARQRDEAFRVRDETSRQHEEALQQKEDVVRQRDEFLKQKDESVRVKEESAKARDVARLEIEGAARLLIGGAEKVTSMVNGVKSFGRSLPASKYTGVQAIAYGFSKRMEEVVEEVLKQKDAAIKAKQETTEHMEQRNYRIAIEVSQLEASLQQLKEEGAKKSSEAELWQKRAMNKDDKFLELEEMFSGKLAQAENETISLRQKADEAEVRSKDVNTELSNYKEMLQEQLKYISKLRKGVLELPHELHPDPVSEASITSLSATSEMLVDEKVELPQQCLAGLKSLLELVASVGVVWRKRKEEWETENHEIVSRIERLVGQKQDAADLLTVALSEKQQVLESISDLRMEVSQHQSEVKRLQISLKEAQDMAEQHRSEDDVKEEENEELLRIRADLTQVAQTRDEALSKVSALESEVTNLRQQIGELETALARARAEVGELRTLTSRQAKELVDKSAQIRELLAKAREVMKRSLVLKMENMTADIDALEEEVARWKQAATEEAAAGAAVLEDVESCQFEIGNLNQQISQLRNVVEEAKLKVRSKEEMAAAAIAARTAAERSLQMADERATELRERVEELNKQIEETDKNREYRGSTGVGLFDMCWPWLRRRGRPRNNGGTQLAAEMEELLEPLV